MLRLQTTFLKYSSSVFKCNTFGVRQLILKPTQWSEENVSSLNKFLKTKLQKGQSIQFTKQQILYILSSHDEHLLDSLSIHANSVTEKTHSNIVKPMGIEFVTNVCEGNCKLCLHRKSNEDIQRYMMTNANIIDDAIYMYSNNIDSICLEGGEINNRNRINWYCDIIKNIKANCHIAEKSMNVYIQQGMLADAAMDQYINTGIDGYIYNMDTINEQRFQDYIGKNFKRLERIQFLEKVQKRTNLISGMLIGMKNQQPFQPILNEAYKESQLSDSDKSLSSLLEIFIKKNLNHYISTETYKNAESIAENDINNDIYQNIQFLMSLKLQGVNINMYSPTRDTPCYSALIYPNITEYYSKMFSKLIKTIALYRCMNPNIDIYTSPYHTMGNEYGCHVSLLSGANAMYSHLSDQWTKQYYRFADEMPSPFPPSDQLYIDKYYCQLANKELKSQLE